MGDGGGNRDWSRDRSRVRAEMERRCTPFLFMIKCTAAVVGEAGPTMQNSDGDELFYVVRVRMHSANTSRFIRTKHSDPVTVTKNDDDECFMSTNQDTEVKSFQFPQVNHFELNPVTRYRACPTQAKLRLLSQTLTKCVVIAGSAESEVVELVVFLAIVVIVDGSHIRVAISHLVVFSP